MRYVLPLLALGLLVALHELGHVLAARLLRVAVRRFSLGLGPPLLSWQLRGTRVTVGAVPLGGSADVVGMNPHEPGADASSPHSLASRPPWQRLAVLLGGPLLNALLAVGLLTGLYLSGTHVPVPMTVGLVEPGSEAARAGLRPGDRVATVDGVPVREWSVLVERVAAGVHRPLRIGVLRSGQAVELRVVPLPDETGAGRIGLSQQYVHGSHPAGESVQLALAHAQRLVQEGLALAGRALPGSAEASLHPPVTALKQASDAAGSGLDAFLRVCAALSLALALGHLLPLPGLDGGRILFALFAWATGRRVSARTETLVHAGGFVLLLGLLGLLAAGELRRMLAPHAPPVPPPTAAAPVRPPELLLPAPAGTPAPAGSAEQADNLPP